MNIMWWLYTNTATNWEVCLPFSGFPLDFLSLYSTCFCSSSSGKNIALAMIDLDQGEFISFLNFFFNFGAFSYVSYVTSVQCTEDFVDFIWEGKFFWCAIFLNKKSSRLSKLLCEFFSNFSNKFIWWRRSIGQLTEFCFEKLMHNLTLIFSAFIGCDIIWNIPNFSSFLYLQETLGFSMKCKLLKNFHTDWKTW